MTPESHIVQAGPIGEEQVAALQRRLERERLARLDAEQIAERTIRELYDKQRELQLVEAIVKVSNESATVEEALQGALGAVCTHTRWPVGHVYLTDDTGKRLVPTMIWHVEPPGAFDEFRRVTEATAFASGIGLPGRVLASQTALWIADVTLDPNFPRRNLGIRGAIGFSIAVNGVVRAVLEFFSPAVVEPDPSVLEVLAQVGTQLGRVIERIRWQEQTAHQALHDALTGLPNRTLFHERMDQALRESARTNRAVSVLIIDLDRFKEVNDTLGHANGDLLLTEVGIRLRSVLRDNDTIARMGGDEFAVLLPGTDAQGGRRVAEKLHKELEEPFTLQRLRISVQASIGIASAPEHGSNAETLLQRADVAMYLAKGGPGSHAVYAAENDQFDPDRLVLAGELRRAITDDELVLHYQPKLDLPTGRPKGVEALVRWEHPTRGLLGPDQFVPLAEQIGMIRPLTIWVLDRALGQCRDWLRAGRRLTVAVNLSVQSLLDPELAGDVATLLDRHGVPPELLELEITESSVMRDPTRSVTMLSNLRAMGVRLSIDDYGTGYSSLAYLKRLPVHEIKIDRAFVMNMDSSADDAVIVRSTVDLGHNLGLTVVAEGVETGLSLSGLRELGCDSAQGYHISRPLPADQLESWLRESL